MTATQTRIVAVLIAIGVFAIDLQLPIGIAAGVPYVAVLLVSIGLPRQIETLLAAIACSILTGLGLFLSPSAGDAELWKVLMNRGLALVAIWVTAGVGFQLRRTREGRLESVARTSAILDAAVDAIITINESGIIESANSAALEIFGCRTDEIVGSNVRTLMPSPQNDAVIASYVQGGEGEMVGVDREVVGLRRNGTTFPMDLAVSEAHTPRGRLFIAVVRDLTDRKQLEEQLLQAQKMEAIGQLAGGVAHDFNNLLGAIQGSGELLMDRAPEGDPFRRPAQRILDAAERGAALTQQLLAFSRRQVTRPEVIDLNDAIREMRDLVARLIGEDVQLELALRETGPMTVRTDGGQIGQVVMNLAVNASDAMPRGGHLAIATDTVDLRSSAASRLGIPEGKYVVLSVVDSGSGIDAKTQRRIFEPFFTTKDRGKGTGLGLSTVYGIVNQNMGTITVDSKPGRGTRFRIYLPAVKESPKTPAPASTVAALSTGTETILVVEDDELMRDLAREVLEMKGYEVFTAATPGEALRIAEREKIELLVTDVVMPGMNGIELAESLHKQHPDLRVLFMSGYTDTALKDRGVMDPGAHFIRKPFKNKALTARVREILGPPAA
jgi:PAS domain S-box-containing protein